MAFSHKAIHLLGWLFTFSLVGVACLCVLYAYGYHEIHKEGPLETSVIVDIKSGLSTRAIAAHLEAENVIEDDVLFLLADKIDPDLSFLKAGTYRFTAGISIAGVLEKLRRADVYTINLTIPEGLSSYQIVALIKEADGLSGTIDTIPKEGSLLPETYSLAYGKSKADLIAWMQSEMSRVVENLWQKRQPDLPLSSPEEAVILASIVEKETGIADERRDVAGVFINRLRKNMRLQSDPTAIYAITKGKGPLGRRLLRKDLQIDSPYNTYVSDGLPPGPICNPGQKSLEAVLNPTHHEYIYFVADGTGGHVFAKTLSQHNRNVANWRKIRANQTANE